MTGGVPFSAEYWKSYEGMNVYIEKVVVTEDQPYGFLLFWPLTSFFSSPANFSNAIINMGQRSLRAAASATHGRSCLGLRTFFGPVAVKTLKYLMVSIADNFFKPWSTKPCARRIPSAGIATRVDFFENALEAS